MDFMVNRANALCSSTAYRVMQAFLGKDTRQASIESEITYITKSHYGGPELVYVTSKHKDALSTLTGAKTLSDRHIKALKDMGFTFKNEQTGKAL